MPIELKNVFYTYPNNDQFSFKDLNINFDGNEIVSIIGKVGSGKSTLLQLLNGLLLFNSGSLKVDDFTIDFPKIINKKGIENNKKELKRIKKGVKNISTLRRNVGLIFQFSEDQLFESSVLKDVTFGPINFNYSKDEAIRLSKEALSLVGLDESFYERDPNSLSGGERRLVSIAGILAFDPKYIILDEPTIGLDSKTIEKIMSILLSLKDKGKVIIFVTHDMDVVLKYSQRVLIIDQGKIIKDTTPIQLFNDTNLINNTDIELPFVLKISNFLKEKGMNINSENIIDIDTLANEIKKVKEK